MPSMRRMRIFGVVVFCAVIYVLYITSNARHTRSPDFYSKTKQALDRDKGPHHPHSPHKGVGIDNEDEALRVDMANRLKEAEQAAKDNANAKSPRPESIDSTRKKAKAGVQDVAPDNKAGDDKNEKVLGEDGSAKEYNVESEMNQILKRSPIIIFSKSYCPHSKRAKGILLDKYSIVPTPYVLELDLHPTGAQLQDKLIEMTGRRTVPNVLINGKSIGGGDDVAELDQTMKLIDKIKTLGGKQMQTVQERS